MIHLTATGRTVVTKAIVRGVTANELTLEPLSVQERQTLIELLRKLAPGQPDPKDELSS